MRQPVAGFRWLWAVLFSGAAREHQRIGLDHRAEYPETPTVEPEYRDLLQLTRQLDRFLVWHYHRRAALAVRPVRRAGIHVRESVARRAEASIEIALPPFVLFRG